MVYTPGRLCRASGHIDVPPARTAVTFSISCPLIFYLKENHLYLLYKLPRVGTTLGTALGFCARAAGPKDFVPVAGDSWAQEGRRGCRGAGEDAGSGHAVAMHPKLAAWRYRPLSLELCQRVAFAEHLSCGNQGALVWLFAGAKEFSGSFRENHLCRTWAQWKEPGAWCAWGGHDNTARPCRIPPGSSLFSHLPSLAPWLLIILADTQHVSPRISLHCE